MAGLLFIACCCLYPKRCFFHSHRAIWWFSGYLIVYVLHGLLLPDKLAATFYQSLFTLTQLFVFFWVALSLLREEKLARGVLLCFAAGSTLLAAAVLFGLAGLSATKVERGTRLTLEGDNPNYIAYLTGLAAVVLIGLLLDGNNRGLWRKVLLGALTLPLFAMTVYTGSRTGIVGLIFGLLIYLLPLQRSERKTSALMWGTLALGAIIYIVASNPLILSRWTSVYSEGNTGGRREIFLACAVMIVEQPAFGWGPVQGEVELGRRLGRLKRNTHSLYLQLLLDVGVIGAWAFLTGVFKCLRAAWRNRLGKLGLLPLALIGTLLVDNLAHSWLYRKPTWLILALALAAGSSLTGKSYQRLKKFERVNV
jgi:O-antigen ligase